MLQGKDSVDSERDSCPELHFFEIDVEGTTKLAGQFLESGCCVDRNAIVDQFPTQIPNAWVAPSCAPAGTEIYHFDLAAQREFRKRYGEQMIEALGL